MIIRLEEEKDWFEVENLTREAFWNVYQPGCVEHLVLHNFRKHPDFIEELSFVMEEEGSKRLVAHIMYCRAVILSDSGAQKEILMFGPVSVLPELQHRGLGSRLIRYSMQKAMELGGGAVAIMGNPEYYHRFGFKSASESCIYHADSPRTEEAPYFMITELQEGYLNGIEGRLLEPEAYIVSDEAVEEFDLKFPPKRKEKLPGQLFG